VIAFALVLLATAPAAQAQSVVDFNTQPRMRIGPFGVTPAIVVQNAGIDRNVFNEATDPKEDFTTVIAPSVDILLRTGRLAARVRNNVNLVYFRRYTNQGGVDYNHDATVAVRVRRITPYASVQFVDTHERPSIEIDTRARRQSSGFSGGLSASLGSRLTLNVEGRRQRLAFAADAVFEGVSLPTVLNDTVTSWTGTARWDVTPLTRIAVDVQRQQDRFELTPSRNATSLRIIPRVEFAPSALLAGHASVGIRNFRSEDPRLPAFTGVVAAVDLSYTMRGRTQFSVRTDRDIAFSYSPSAPYYMLTTVGGAVTQRFRDSWDVTGSGSRQRLAYRTVLVAPAAPGAPAQPVAGVPEGLAYTYVLGAGFRFARSSRVGFSSEYSARPAGLSGEFRNFRYFTNLTYAF
jgi:hypothetical protein